MKQNFLIFLLFLFFPFFIYSSSFDFSYQLLAKKVLESYPEIKKSLYDVDIAILEEETAKYSEYPTLQMTMYGFPIMMNVHYDQKRNLTFDLTDWKPAVGAKISLTIPVYTFGRISNIKKVALLNRLAKEQDVLLSQLGVKRQIKDLYWGYLSYNSIKKYIFDVILPKMEKDIKDKENDFNKGKVSRSNLENSKISFLEIKTLQLDLKKNKDYLDNLLSSLIAKSSLDSLNINFKIKYLFQAELELKTVEYYLNLAHQNHPQLKKGQFQAEANTNYTEYLKANNRPLIGFGLSGGYNYFDFSYPVGGERFFPQNGAFFTIGFTFDWNISWWQTINNNQKAETQNLKNLEDVKLGINLFESTIKTAYDNLIYQQEKLKYQKQVLQIAQRSSIFNSNANKTGVTSDSDLFGTLKTLFYKLKDYYQGILSYNLALAEFEKILGEDLINYNELELKQMEEELFDKSDEETE